MIMIPRRLTAALLAASFACSAALAQDSVPTTVPGATTAPAGPELTLEQCINRALARNFTLRQPPQDIPYAAFSALQTLEAGQVAEMIAEATKGYLVYAQEKKQPDLTPANPRYAELQQQMMLRTSANNSSAYLAELVERELKKSEPAAP